MLNYVQNVVCLVLHKTYSSLNLDKKHARVRSYVGIVRNGEASSKWIELCVKEEAGYGCYVKEQAKPV